ncbi:hypothetical protein D7I43_27285 [Micromonospora globbae]|uniref:Uncharacterized protein n=1 Tax=Micromonospora globbae TaxID=1894969 RepID=A0A420EUH8_9ACTN|nr:hypothetical protein D7I43_27285 [Micromonospora globbae]
MTASAGGFASRVAAVAFAGGAVPSAAVEDTGSESAGAFVPAEGAAGRTGPVSERGVAVGAVVDAGVAWPGAAASATPAGGAVPPGVTDVPADAARGEAFRVDACGDDLRTDVRFVVEAAFLPALAGPVGISADGCSCGAGGSCASWSGAVWSCVGSSGAA